MCVYLREERKKKRSILVSASSQQRFIYCHSQPLTSLSAFLLSVSRAYWNNKRQIRTDCSQAHALPPKNITFKVLPLFCFFSLFTFYFSTPIFFGRDRGERKHERIRRQGYCVFYDHFSYRFTMHTRDCADG